MPWRGVVGEAIESPGDTSITSVCRGRDTTRLRATALLHSAYLRRRARRNFFPSCNFDRACVQRKYGLLVVKIRPRHTINFFLTTHLKSDWVSHKQRKRSSKWGPSKLYDYPSAQLVTLKQSLRHLEKSMQCTYTIIKGIGGGGKTTKVQRKILLLKIILK